MKNTNVPSLFIYDPEAKRERPAAFGQLEGIRRIAEMVSNPRAAAKYVEQHRDEIDLAILLLLRSKIRVFPNKSIGIWGNDDECSLVQRVQAADVPLVPISGSLLSHNVDTLFGIFERGAHVPVSEKPFNSDDSAVGTPVGTSERYWSRNWRSIVFFAEAGRELKL